MTPPAAASGLLIVDKPAGWTSHDVVARVRRLAGARRVGHAGTLDPMATGVLVLGIEKATRLLGHLTLTDKEYLATIRLGQATDTGDAEGEVMSTGPTAGLDLERVRAAAAAFTGDLLQVPPGVSAVKVGGVRAYRLARAGQAPELPARAVTVREFEIIAVRRTGEMLDVDARVACSSGTYIRALARDIGESLGAGGHLAMLRRTRVGPYTLARARTMADLEADRESESGLRVIPLAEAAAAAFGVRRLSEPEARTLAHGGSLPPDGGSAGAGAAGHGPVAALAPDGTLVALVAERDGRVRPLAVFAP